MSAPGRVLTELLSPIDYDAFFREHWEQKPLLVSRDDPYRYADVLTLRDVDQVIAYTRPRFADTSAFDGQSAGRPTYVRGVLAGQSSAVQFEPGLADLRAIYEEGKSVVIMSMHRRWPAVAELCRNLEVLFHCPVHANMYLTPAGAQGFAAHYDPHEVFILQLEGAKHWRLYDQAELLPLASDKDGTPALPLGAVSEAYLKAGDLLYIPRGHVHDAYTADSFSLHLTVGINMYRWADLIHHALTCASRKDARFRESMTAGGVPGGSVTGNDASAKQRFQQLLSLLSDSTNCDQLFDDALGSLVGEFYGKLPMLPGTQFSSQVDLDQIGLATVLEKNPQAICRVLENDEGVAIEFPGNRVGGPRRIAAALRFIAETQRFAVRDLPDELNGQAKVVLVRRLIREGLLTPVGQPQAAPRGARDMAADSQTREPTATGGDVRPSAPARGAECGGTGPARQMLQRETVER